jgi:hypothetical protein
MVLRAGTRTPVIPSLVFTWLQLLFAINTLLHQGNLVKMQLDASKCSENSNFLATWTDSIC